MVRPLSLKIWPDFALPRSINRDKTKARVNFGIPGDISSIERVATIHRRLKDWRMPNPWVILARVW